MNGILSDKRGFTLLEIMVVVGIMGILMSVAAINYVKMAPQRRLDGAAFDVLTALRQARMLAAGGNTRARVTLSGNDISVWVDNDNDGAVDAGESFTKSIDSRITVYKYPETGTFSSRGMFEPGSAASYMYLGLYMADVGWQYIYIFPSGQVDLYNY